MAHVLLLSSWVAHGHVGISAAAPALQALGHSVTQLPTVQLSNHAGWTHVAGRPTEIALLSDWVEALDRNGWLAQVDAILTGYMPSAAHVEFAATLIKRLKGTAPRVRAIVDPILGDSPKGLYIAPQAAIAIRDALVPLADVLTPNRYELSWLSERRVEKLNDTQDAARTLGGTQAEVLVTSVPAGPGKTGVFAVTTDTATLYTVPLAPGAAQVPNGVGDVFSALVAGGCTVGAALGHLQALIDQSLGAPHLRIAETAEVWTKAKPIAPDITAPLTDPDETG